MCKGITIALLGSDAMRYKLYAGVLAGFEKVNVVIWDIYYISIRFYFIVEERILGVERIKGKISEYTLDVHTSC